MSMARIVKSKSAPEGEIHVSLGNVSFSLDADGGYETDDRDVITDAQQHDYLEVEYQDDQTPTQRARAEHREIEQEKKRRGKAERERAEKDPADPAPEVEVRVPGPEGSEQEGETQVPVSDSQEGLE